MNSYSSKNDYGGSGLGLLGETLPDTIKIEHVFTLQIPSKWDRPLRKWVDKCLDLSKQYAESFHFIAVGIGSYFFLLGCSKIVAASNNNRTSSNNDGDTPSTSTKKKTRSKNPKTKENANGSDSSKNEKTTQPPQETSTMPKATVAKLPTTDSEQKV